MYLEPIKRQVSTSTLHRSGADEFMNDGNGFFGIWEEG